MLILLMNYGLNQVTDQVGIKPENVLHTEEEEEETQGHSRGVSLPLFRLGNAGGVAACITQLPSVP